MHSLVDVRKSMLLTQYAFLLIYVKLSMFTIRNDEFICYKLAWASRFKNHFFQKTFVERNHFFKRICDMKIYALFFVTGFHQGQSGHALVYVPRVGLPNDTDSRLCHSPHSCWWRYWKVIIFRVPYLKRLKRNFHWITILSVRLSDLHNVGKA